MGRVECDDEASNEKRTRVRDKRRIEQGTSADWQIDARGDPYTHMYVCTSNKSKNNNSEQ